MAEDGFAQLIDEGNSFFAALSQNNTKEWFNPRKDHYTQNIKKPAEFLGEVLAEDFNRIAGRAYRPKLFRIYRDVRFSRDKTPFNAHLHMIWRQPDGDPFAPAFFFGSEPGKMTVGFGIMGLKGTSLAQFRRFVDQHGAALSAAISNSGMEWSDWGAPPLKRVPAPFDKDHPYGGLLRKRSMIISRAVPEGWREAEGGLVKAIRDQFEATQPISDLLFRHLQQ